MTAIQNSNEHENRRTGASWETFLATFRISGITESGDGYDVKSTSGHTYHVHDEPRTDRYSGSTYFVWHCNCSARKRCRHIDAVVQMRWAEAAADEDYEAMDMMEWEED